MLHPHITLYWYWSTNPQKVRLALEELQVSYELKRINLGKLEHKTPAYEKLNPRMKVPTLQVGDVVLWDSGAALVYLAELFPEFWPVGNPDKGQALSLMFMESTAFQIQAGTHYWQKVIQPLLRRQANEEKLKAAVHKIQPLLKILSDQLGDTEYLFGNMTLVDCAFATWLPHINLSEWPNLNGWRTRLMSRPSWLASELRLDLT